MKLNELSPAEGSKKDRKRLGRGLGSGQGKTAGKGHKGQNSRSGGGVAPGFEGGQMPLQRRLPKRGFKNIFALTVAEINVRDLNRFAEGSVVDAQVLADSGLIKGSFDAIKLLGQGAVEHAVTVQVNLASEGAMAKVTAAGGKVELI
ncbi:MAG: 50S ribosomal protein L15 [Deltaproteobacteria bacterium]|nr:50S ribosomal protein L15 [Deltaproteobacteria bacterium]